jgi:competence protein ComEA
MDRVSTNLQMTVVGVAVLLVVGGLVWFGLPSREAPPAGADSVAPIPRPERVTVHVSGAVIRPGLVEVDAEARVADAVAAAGGATSEADLGAMNLASTLRDGDHIAVPAIGMSNSPGGFAESGIDLNTASASKLEELPGVGPVLAERIVEFREREGRFESVEDLLDVPGIGESKLAQMREVISSP